MQKIYITIFFSLLHLAVTAQNSYTSEKDIYKTNEIFFYGYDYTGFKLIDEKHMGHNITLYVKDWISYCNEKITPTYLQKVLEKEKVTFDYVPTLSLNQKVPFRRLVTAEPYTLAKDSLQAMVSRYDIKQQEGVGFVVIYESFDRKGKTVSAYYTFFDIASRKILNPFYIVSKEGDSYNNLLDWRGALGIAFKDKFIPQYKKASKE